MADNENQVIGHNKPSIMFKCAISVFIIVFWLCTCRGQSFFDEMRFLSGLSQVSVFQSAPKLTQFENGNFGFQYQFELGIVAYRHSKMSVTLDLGYTRPRLEYELNLLLGEDITNGTNSNISQVQTYSDITVSLGSEFRLSKHETQGFFLRPRVNLLRSNLTEKNETISGAGSRDPVFKNSLDFEQNEFLLSLGLLLGYQKFFTSKLGGMIFVYSNYSISKESVNIFHFIKQDYRRLPIGINFGLSYKID